MRGLKTNAARCQDQTRSEIRPVPSLVFEGLKSPGRPLGPELRANMESRFGHDFSRVRVHADETAAASALSVGALAFAYGRDLVFGRGQYRPETQSGRELLAHELGHLAEHRGYAPFLARAVPATAAPGEAAVKTALEGDDDDVRALTESPHWPSVTLTPSQAAQLIMHLLSGFTGDDDEIAGLRILRKTLTKKELDATLAVLNSKGEFDDLLDDYHGAEYRELLDLLSVSMKETPIKAVFLDQFTGWWTWVREHEEKAIVVMLEHSDPDQNYELLTEKNRYVKLRSAIDTEDYSRRFEKLMKQVNVTRGEVLTTRIETAFVIKAEKSRAAGTRSEGEIQNLLLSAMFDLARELVDWRTLLEAALKDPKKSASDIAEINEKFEARLDKLLEDKKAEFGFELKYNLEFDRSLRKGFRRSWTSEDLKIMDEEILSKIPPEILHAKPNFRRFLREKGHEEFAGQASSHGRITLAGVLSLRTTIHELGHMVHFDDEVLYKEFRRLSSWEELEAKFFANNNLEDLRSDLDGDRAAKREDKRRSHGDYYYRYARYQAKSAPPKYWRYPQNACFISDYAKTDPMDDFADTLEEYFVDPDNLKSNCLEKYNFMHQKVFIEYWLRKEVGRYQKTFDDERDKALGDRTESWRLLNPIRQKYINVFRSSMMSGLTTLQAQKVAAGRSGGLAQPVPLKGYTGLEQKAAPYLERLRLLLALIQIPLLRYSDFVITREVAELLFIETKLKATHKTVVDRLSQEFADELLALIYPLAQHISSGKKVKKENWPEVEAVAGKYRKAGGVIESYLPNYRALPLRGNFYYQESIQAALEFPAGPVFNKVDQYIQDQDLLLSADLQALEAEMDRRVRAGIAFKASEVADPRKLTKKYHDLVSDFKRKLKKK